MKKFIIILLLLILTTDTTHAMDKWGFFAGHSGIDQGDAETVNGLILGAGGLKKSPIKEYEKLDILYLTSLTTSKKYTIISFDFEADYYLIKGWELIGGVS